MSAPQPPEDRDPSRASGTAGTSDEAATYDFHGEKLDFDPYRFGAPEVPTAAWNPTAPSAPGADPARPPAPGERWNPTGGADPTSEVRPGDYWQGGGSQPRGGGGVFPPAGYTPPPAGQGSAGQGSAGQGSGATTGVDLGKAPEYPPPTGYPAPGGYPPPSGRPSPGGYPTAGGYPSAGGPSEADRWRAGNKIAVAGFAVAMAACVLFFTSIIAVLIGGTGLGLSIAGYVKARRGAPHKTFAVLGIVFSIVAIVAGIAILAYALSQYDLSCIADLQGDSSRLSECVR